MTAIVGVLNSRGIAMAADSAVTVTGNNLKKVYNRSNKIFTLSKFHPVGIAIYNSADFMGIPLETIIKLYRQRVKDVPFRTLKEYKDDFTIFLKDQLKFVSPELKRDLFYNFCYEAYNAIIAQIVESVKTRNAEISAMTEQRRQTAYDAISTDEIAKYLAFVAGEPMATYINISLQDFTTAYQNHLDEINNYIQSEIQKDFATFTLKNGHRNSIIEVLHRLINIEYLFERYSGLVFFGFGDDEIYPSTEHILVGMAINGTPRVRTYDSIKIVPGVSNSNIVPFAQGDVTRTVLTGVDPQFKNEVQQSIKNSFKDVSGEISGLINNPAQSTLIDAAMDRISQELIVKLDEYQRATITQPLLDILTHMGKEDMSELAESLVSITSIKRKFTSNDSSDESVGGPVDVAIITKGDGFVWMKRKHYFDAEINKGFMSNYYKL